MADTATQTKPTQPQQQKDKAPLAPTQPVPKTSWQEEQEAYLNAHGWECVGMNDFGISFWKDPVGSDDPPVLEDRLELPSSKQKGKKEIIQQWVGKPIPWTWRIEQAVRIQHERDHQEKISPEILALRKKREDLKKVIDQGGENGKAAQKELQKLVY